MHIATKAVRSHTLFTLARFFLSILDPTCTLVCKFTTVCSLYPTLVRILIEPSIKLHIVKSFKRIILFLLSFGIFSWVRNGIGLYLSNLGILLLLLLHHVNLRTIKEQPKTRYPTISYSSMKLTISFVFLILFFAIAALFSIIFTWNIYVLHIRNIWSLFFAFIVIPKYYINQNENLRLYVSVYHLVPAPVLPWQLPSNFDRNSVKLTYVNYPNNE